MNRFAWADIPRLSARKNRERIQVKIIKKPSKVYCCVQRADLDLLLLLRLLLLILSLLLTLSGNSLSGLILILCDLPTESLNLAGWSEVERKSRKVEAR